MKILFFIGNLGSGGKERRLIELIKFLVDKPDVSIHLVLLRNYVHYFALSELDIKVDSVVKIDGRKNPLKILIRIFAIVKGAKPDVLNTWGSEEAFYSILACKWFGIPLVNSQITTAPLQKQKINLGYITDHINYMFSDVILANSLAGLAAHHPPPQKSFVIYNGLDLSRFTCLPDALTVKKQYNIKTMYAVVMVASFTQNKDYDSFIGIANIVTSKRDDVSFICVGADSRDSSQFDTIRKTAQSNARIILTGRINDVESLVNACDIGVLLSPNGEGTSNSILEYMALGKPVIANDAGGTREIVKDKLNGYLVKNINIREIADITCILLDNSSLRSELGALGRQIICDRFTYSVMGQSYLKLYKKVINLE